MNKIALIACFWGAMLYPMFASADSAKDCDKKNDPRCEAWQTGTATPLAKPIPCLVTITAPTFGGQVGLEVRDANGKSRWGKPRIKQAKPGWVTYRIGCGWLKEPTDEVYLCVKGPNGVEYYSRRTRKAGELTEVLVTQRLEMCLKGSECPKYVESTRKQK